MATLLENDAKRMQSDKMKAPQAVVAGVEAPGVGYGAAGTAQIERDPPYSAANFCCPSPLSFAL